MATWDIWPVIHAERAALADDLTSLDDAKWSTASLCDGWTVRDVMAHMTATAKISAGAFLPKLIGAGFRLTAMQAKDMVVTRGSSAADTLANFKAEVNSSKHPPGPGDTWLGETLVHAEDIRRPLGIAHTYPTDAAVRLADFFKGSNLIIGAKRRIAGVRLKATDADWSTGDGPEASGPIMAIVMVMTGRKAALADLAGDGVSVLSSRS